MAPSWFQQLFGAAEPTSYAAAQALFRVAAATSATATTTSLRLSVHAPDATRETFDIGRFATPTLAELRTAGRAVLAAAAAANAPTSPTSLRPPRSSSSSSSSSVELRHVAVSSALELHAAHPGATFQAASQFNCLEFPSPTVTPEHGVTGYADDRTQGPDCALACAPGTVYRTYWTPVATPTHEDAAPGLGASSAAAVSYGVDAARTVHVGQTAEHQLDTLATLGTALGNALAGYWTVQNGYVRVGHGGTRALAEVAARLDNASENERDRLRALVRIGVHEDTEVVWAARWRRAPKGLRVTQAYCSALSLGSYGGNVDPALWAPLARLVLESAYEATLWTAVLAASRPGGVPDVYLTFVGGGVFGNDLAWIMGALARAVATVGAAGAALNVYVCHFRHINEPARRMLDALLV